MPTRTRSAAALAMSANSDAEMEEEQELVDVGEDDGESGGDAEESEEGEDAMRESEEDEIQSEEENEEPEDEEDEDVSTAPRLKIKLKLPTQPTLSSGHATPAKGPSSPSKPSRRYRPIIPESEDETGEGASSDASEEAPLTSRSATGTPSRGTRPMTTRQAVLASVVGSHHVSLDEGSRSKKQPLNETELALRREETARKRKNLTEKKLEDEKAETINRLLKRQSRPRNRRNNTDVTPQENAEEGEGEEAVEGVQPVHEEVIKPVMYRWISTSRSSVPSTEPSNEKRMAITFSVPTIVEMPLLDKTEPRPSASGVCAVEGCGAARKYRLVRHFDIGACGIAHLKVLEERHEKVIRTSII